MCHTIYPPPPSPPSIILSTFNIRLISPHSSASNTSVESLPLFAWFYFTSTRLNTCFITSLTTPLLLSKKKKNKPSLDTHNIRVSSSKMPNRKRNQSAVEDLGSSRGFKRIRSTTGCLSLKNISQHNRTTGDVSNDISSVSPTLVGSNPHDLSDNEWPVIQETFDTIQGAGVSSSNNPTSQRRNSDFTPDSLHLESRSRYLAPFLSRHGILLSQFENIAQGPRKGISNFRRIVDEIPESIRNEGSYETDSEGRTVRRCAHPISQRANSLSSTASSSSLTSSTTLSIQPSTSPSSSNTISDDGSVSDSDDESNTLSSSSTSSGSQSESRSSTPFPSNFPITHSPTRLPPIFRPSQPTNQNYNDIQSRIANLLPALRAANQALEQERANGRLADRDIENLGEEEGEYIEMVCKHPPNPLQWV